MTSRFFAPRGPRAALFFSIASLCLLPALAQSPQAPRSGPSLTPQALFERAAPSVWVLQANDAQGKLIASGNAVALGPGIVLTSCQLLTKASQLSLRRDNVSYGATLEYPDVERDLCQLRVPNLPATSLQIVPATELAVGMALYSIGAPRGQEMALGVGMLAAVRRTAHGGLEALQLATAPEAGLAGAGLFDSQGRLAGLISATPAGSAIANVAMPAAWVPEISTRGRAAIEAFAAQPRAATSATLAVGASSFSTLEYTLRDRLTGNTRQVIYRLDAPQTDRRSFNNSGWVEKISGEVLSVGTSIAGEFDGSMPPGGWVRDALTLGATWSLAYTSPAHAQMSLTATAAETETLTIAGRNLETVRVDFRGSMVRGPAVSGFYHAEAWYSPELKRVVRFGARSRGGSGSAAYVIREEIELTAIR